MLQAFEQLAPAALPAAAAFADTPAATAAVLLGTCCKLLTDLLLLSSMSSTTLGLGRGAVNFISRSIAACCRQLIAQGRQGSS
jgi:hypothetical protein